MISVQNQTKAVELIEGNFSIADANSIISRIIDECINLYKLQHLKSWVKDHNTPSVDLDEKIKELHHKKAELKQLLNQSGNQSINIESILKITLSE